MTGQERTFRQDPLFTFRLLADIGLRALSPDVNDPATAVQVLDTVESLLLPLAPRDLDVAEVADDTGTVRVVLAQRLLAGGAAGRPLPSGPPTQTRPTRCR